MICSQSDKHVNIGLERFIDNCVPGRELALVLRTSRGVLTRRVSDASHILPKKMFNVQRKSAKAKKKRGTKTIKGQGKDEFGFYFQKQKMNSLAMVNAFIVHSRPSKHVRAYLYVIL